MSVEPPSSGRPTGPPSGPLSGPSRPGATQQSGTPGAGPPGSTPPPGGDRPSGPPSGRGPGGDGPGDRGGSGDGGGGGQEPSGGPGQGPAPDRPWWKSAPRVAMIGLAVVAAVVLTVVLTRPDGAEDSGGEVLLQAAGKPGPDPFTESTARDDGTPPSPTAPADSSASANVTRGIDGAAPGLYGGTRKVGACDVEKQVDVLGKDPAKNKAFASALDIDAAAVPTYLRALTPAQLRMDTRVTNHGYRDGAPTAYQAVLQAGTAVLVDDRGVPRVRCACGNPLLPPVAQQSTPKRTGDAWPGYRSSDVVFVAPAAHVVNVFVMYDPKSGEWFARDKGDTGAGDKKTQPPADQPSPSPSLSMSSSSPSPSSPSPSSPSPSSGEPSAPSPATEEEQRPEYRSPETPPSPGAYRGP
ncbi:DUF6777 domain-containing protein [Streptomyces flavofungini]|uniref:DUF6777 domain-containing protein n=1 Tax=Streptomyces flavofungini TaxID=68200 RepID=UPI0025B035CF|nr:DUF6777 domain-containing protein [Streptomyces flavofungini]WJV50235.1 hypothetical protein QUY26_34825 [Streptomyces flavofungini]